MSLNMKEKSYPVGIQLLKDVCNDLQEKKMKLGCSRRCRREVKLALSRRFNKGIAISRGNDEPWRKRSYGNMCSIVSAALSPIRIRTRKVHSFL